MSECTTQTWMNIAGTSSLTVSISDCHSTEAGQTEEGLAMKSLNIGIIIQIYSCHYIEMTVSDWLKFKIGSINVMEDWHDLFVKSFRLSGRLTFSPRKTVILFKDIQLQNKEIMPKWSPEQCLILLSRNEAI